MDTWYNDATTQFKTFREVREMTTITTRAKAFGRVETVRCRVEDDGTVLVWDEVAGHYTRCHGLSAAAKRRIRREAEASLPDEGFGAGVPDMTSRCARTF